MWILGYRLKSFFIDYQLLLYLTPVKRKKEQEKTQCIISFTGNKTTYVKGKKANATNKIKTKNNTGYRKYKMRINKITELSILINQKPKPYRWIIT